HIELSDAVNRTSKVLDFACKMPAQEHAPGVRDDVVERATFAGYGLPELGEFGFAALVMQHGAHFAHEVVARRAFDTPMGIQAFAGSEDFFHHDVGWRLQAGGTPGRQAAKACAKVQAVFLRIGQTVDVIDADPVDQALAIKSQHQTMYRIEYRLLLDPQSDQVADLEKTAPVHLFGGVAPPCQAIVLALEQAVQALPTLRVARIVSL